MGGSEIEIGDGTAEQRLANGAAHQVERFDATVCRALLQLGKEPGLTEDGGEFWHGK